MVVATVIDETPSLILPDPDAGANRVNSALIVTVVTEGPSAVQSTCVYFCDLREVPLSSSGIADKAVPYKRQLQNAAV